MNRTQIRAAAERIAQAVVDAANRSGDTPPATDIADAAELVIQDAVTSARAESQSGGQDAKVHLNGIVPHDLKVKLDPAPVQTGTLTGVVGTQYVLDSGTGELLFSDLKRVAGQIFYADGLVVMGETFKREPYSFTYISKHP